MKCLSLLVILITCAVTPAFSQRTVTGTVVDDRGEPLIGASILILGTSSGTVSDTDGAFRLSVPDGSNTLRISYTGFRSTIVDISAIGQVAIVMETDAIGLDDVIVVGYASQRKKDVTGAVSSVDSDEFANEAGLSIENALRGRAAGVQVFQTSGTPGSAVNVRVRGSTSINASNQPLYIIDGVPLISGSLSQVDDRIGGQTLNALADINPNDIESIEVLKDAASAAQYGNRAANGVVLITTKKGQAGRTKVNLDASYGFQEAANLVELGDTAQYRAQMATLFGNPNFLAGAFQGNTNWYDEIFHTGTLQNYQLSASGGDTKTRFYTSLNYNDNQGIVRKSQFERYSGRLNVDHVASEKLTLAANIGYNYTKNQRIRNDNNIFGAVSVATLGSPTIPVFNADGSYATAFGWDNPVASVTIYENLITTSRTTGEVYGRYEILSGLFAKAKIGADMLDLREEVYEPSALQSSVSGTGIGAQSRNTRWLTEYSLSYQTDAGDLNIYALAGAGFQEDRLNQSFAEVNDFPTDEFTGLSSGATPTTIKGSFSGDRLNSYFGNVNLTFKNKYILTLTGRADGSSRFVNDKWGFFPGIAAAWQISDEPFALGGFFDWLKLRAGYGVTGNNSIGNFTSLQVYSGGNNYQDAPGIAPFQLGNPDLTWETTSQVDIGIDFAVLESRLSGGIGLYLKKTKDLLFNLPIPTTSGFTTVPRNIGDVENKGIEILIEGVPVRNRNLTWTISANASYNKNEIVKLFNGQPVDAGFATRLAEGQPIGAFFGHVSDGIFQNQAEVDAHAVQPNAAPGDIRFKDISGGPGPDGVLGTGDDLPPDGVINDNDRTFIGKGLPDWAGGLNNDLSYKGVTLSAFVQFALGNDIFNNNSVFSEGMHSVFNTSKRAWEGRWQEEGDDEDFPRAATSDPNGNTRVSDRFVENGSFARLKTASLSYEFPASLIERIGLQSVRIYVSGTNLITLTDYSWFDPEVSTFGETNTTPGTDFLTYPQARSVVFGVHLGF